MSNSKEVYSDTQDGLIKLQLEESTSNSQEKQRTKGKLQTKQKSKEDYKQAQPFGIDSLLVGNQTSFCPNGLVLYPFFTMKAFLKGLKMTIDGKEPWLCARTSRWRRSTFQLEKSKETNVRYHLESDFSGLVYNLFDECQNIHLTIVYTSFENMCQTTPRSIEMYLLKENVAYSTLVGTGSDLKTLYKDNRGHIHFMRTKQAQYNPASREFELGFGVSDMKPAVTNCILVDSEGKEMFKMFKCRQKIHSMRFAHPLRPLHLFAFALSSFDFKLFCQ